MHTRRGTEGTIASELKAEAMGSIVLRCGQHGGLERRRPSSERTRVRNGLPDQALLITGIEMPAEKRLSLKVLTVERSNLIRPYEPFEEYRESI